jgi:hypothetical protein
MFIDLHQLQEIKRSGTKYTWSNKQVSPVMVNLEMVFASVEWENKHPMCFAWSKTRIGSYRCPVMLDTGEESRKKVKYFYFEDHWLLEEGFSEHIGKVWQRGRDSKGASRYSADVWQGCLAGAQKHLRGWNANKRSETYRLKNETFAKLKYLDMEGDLMQDNTEVWVERYSLEAVMENILQQEEFFWQQRSRE